MHNVNRNTREDPYLVCTYHDIIHTPIMAIYNYG